MTPNLRISALSSGDNKAAGIAANGQSSAVNLSAERSSPQAVSENTEKSSQNRGFSIYLQSSEVSRTSALGARDYAEPALEDLSQDLYKSLSVLLDSETGEITHSGNILPQLPLDPAGIGKVLPVLPSQVQQLSSSGSGADIYQHPNIAAGRPPVLEAVSGQAAQGDAAPLPAVAKPVPITTLFTAMAEAEGYAPRPVSGQLPSASALAASHTIMANTQAGQNSDPDMAVQLSAVEDLKQAAKARTDSATVLPSVPVNSAPANIAALSDGQSRREASAALHIAQRQALGEATPATEVRPMQIMAGNAPEAFLAPAAAADRSFATFSGVTQAPLPGLDLGATVDRLMDARLTARSERTVMELPHQDFGKVTMALSISRDDRLMVDMADTNPELRHALNQSVVAAARSEAGGLRQDRTGQENPAGEDAVSTASSDSSDNHMPGGNPGMATDRYGEDGRKKPPDAVSVAGDDIALPEPASSHGPKGIFA